MRCEFCDVEITAYPVDGICVHCGGKLPPRQEPVQSVQQVYIPVPQPVYIPAQPQNKPAYCCPKCGSTQVEQVKRGFSWGLAILGFFLIPGWGLLLGFIGMKKPRLHCRSCNRKWKA